jgi:hypothetical protein
MKLSYLLPPTFLVLGYCAAEGRDYTPPPLPQGERYVSAQLFGVPDTPAHMVIALMPSRTATLGERAIDEIVVTKRVKRVIPDVGWDPEREFAKMDRETAPPARKSYPADCPIPRGIWNAINELDVSPYVKSVIAGAGWIESRWDVNSHHYDNDGGYSHGVWQLHGKWRKVDVDWMKRQPGGWRCPKNNLAAFLRTIKQHEKYYPKSRSSWKLKLARFNGGSRANLAYANKCLAKAKELQGLF